MCIYKTQGLMFECCVYCLIISKQKDFLNFISVCLEVNTNFQLIVNVTGYLSIFYASHFF